MCAMKYDADIFYLCKYVSAQKSFVETFHDMSEGAMPAIKTWNGDEGLIYLRKGVRIKFLASPLSAINSQQAQ